MRKAPSSAYEYALELLTARQYTTQRLRRKLTQKGFSAADVNSVVERLTNSRLLDDSRYAAQFARAKLLGSGGASKRRIKQQLYQRGISEEISAPAIAAVIEDEEIDLSAVIEKDARKKVATLGSLEPAIVRRRLYAHLGRRGYDIDEINAVMKKVLPR